MLLVLGMELRHGSLPQGHAAVAETHLWAAAVSLRVQAQSCWFETASFSSGPQQRSSSQMMGRPEGLQLNLVHYARDVGTDGATAECCLCRNLPCSQAATHSSQHHFLSLPHSRPSQNPLLQSPQGSSPLMEAPQWTCACSLGQSATSR